MSSPPGMPPSSQISIPGRGRARVYDSRGDGPPVVLLHGWTSTSALNWYRVAPALCRSHRVVALDHRGHGRGIRARVPFRLEDCADDVAALVDHLGIAPCTLVGYSMGGPVAQLAWRRRPEAVSELVLCATASRFTAGRLWASPAGLLPQGAAATLSLIPPRLRRSGMSAATSRWGARGNGAGWTAQEWARNDPSALVQAGIALARFDSRGWVDRIDVPTAVVVTERDTRVAPAEQRYLSDHIPGAAAFPVEGDHRACVDAARVFTPVLLAAIDAVQHRRRTTGAPAGGGADRSPGTGSAGSLVV